MNEELQRQLAAMLEKLTAAVEQGAIFAGDQIPPLVAEKILLGRALSTAYLLSGLVLLAIGLRLTWRVWAWVSDVNTSDRDAAFGGVLCTVAALSPGLAVIYGNLHQVFLVWFAPRLYIVEWLRELVR